MLRPLTAVHSARVPGGPLPRVGIVNLIPHAEEYERWFMPQLAASLPIQPLWIRVDSRRYTLDNADHINRTYRAMPTWSPRRHSTA